MKKLIVLAMFFTIFPINCILETGYTIQEMDITYFIGDIIGLVLYSIYFKRYTSKQRKRFIAIVLFSCINYGAIIVQKILDMDINQWKSNTLSDMGPYIIIAVVFFGAYLCKIVVSTILGISILKNKNFHLY